MSVRIQIRGDLASAWSTVNPVLAEREIGIETDTRYFKIGNGTLAWNSLPYALSPDLYQSKLVSGTSIKTINGESLLGSVYESKLSFELKCCYSLSYQTIEPSAHD